MGIARCISDPNSLTVDKPRSLVHNSNITKGGDMVTPSEENLRQQEEIKKLIREGNRDKVDQTVDESIDQVRANLRDGYVARNFTPDKKN